MHLPPLAGLALPLLVWARVRPWERNPRRFLHVVLLLTVEEVLNNLVRRSLEHTRNLRVYHGCRTYRLDTAASSVSRPSRWSWRVKYESPGTKEFTVRSESGSELVLERVFNRLLQGEQEALNEENQSQVGTNVCWCQQSSVHLDHRQAIGRQRQG
jgi:hypothetical protein